MAHSSDPARDGPAAYAPRRVREAEAERARERRQDQDRYLRLHDITALEPEGESEWMTGDIPQFIDPAAAPHAVGRAAAVPETGDERGRGRRGVFPWLLVASAALLAALFVVARASVWESSPSAAASTQVADAASSEREQTAGPAAGAGEEAQIEGAAAEGAAATPEPASGKGSALRPVSVRTVAVQAPSPTSDITPPASDLAPASTPAAAPQFDPVAAAALRKRAEEFVAQGDISAARVLLRRAAEARDAQAAFALAETYDPVALQKLGVRGAAPDPALARVWYGKARELGLPAMADSDPRATQGAQARDGR